MQRSMLIAGLGLLSLLFGCTNQNQTPTATTSYQSQWFSAFTGNFAVSTGAGVWTVLVSDDFSHTDSAGVSVYPAWSWSDTSGGIPAFRGGEAVATGPVHGTTQLKGVPDLPIRVSMDIRLSSIDSNAAGIMVIDSGGSRRYRVDVGRNAVGQAAPGMLTVACASTDSAHALIAEAHQTVAGLAADSGYQLVMTLDTMSLAGEVLHNGSLIARVAVDSGSGALFSPSVSAGVDLGGAGSSPLYADNYAVGVYQPTYAAQSSCIWQWNDSSAIRQDAMGAAMAVGHAVGALFCTQPDTTGAPLRISLDVGLSTAAGSAAAVTVLDSALNRRYWLIIGNNGVGQAAAGMLSLIVTQAASPQAVVAQSQQPAQDPGSVVCQLVLTLDSADILGEMRVSGSTVAQTRIAATPIAAGNTHFLFPGVDLIGTASSPVRPRSFQIEVCKTFSVSPGGSGGGSGGGSCPLVYSFDGTRYYRESETFAGAIFKAAERAEYDRLYMLKAIGGQCLLRIANELPEDHFVNQVALVAVDAPTGVEPIFGAGGIAHSLSSPVKPRRGTDLAGADVLGAIDARDGVMWESDLSARDFSDAAAERDGLILTFDKPSGARTMKLVVDGINTYLEIFTMETAFRSMGSKRTAFYDELEKSRKRQDELIALMRREAGLHISVRHDGVWREVGALRDVGPLIRKQQVAVLDVGDVIGDSVTLKLECATDLWRIDRVFADFMPDAEMSISQAAPLVARDQANRDVRGLLASDDSLYYTDRMGEHATVIFSDPPRASGRDRYYFVKTQGYYHNWLATPQRTRVASWSEILFGPELNGKKFWDSWIEAKSRYQ